MTAAIETKGNRVMVDWIPGAISGVVAGLAGSALTAWRALAVLEEHSKASDAKFEERGRLHEEKFHSLADNQEKAERKAERRDDLVMGEIRDALKGMQGLAADVKVIAADQGAINRITTKTLESLMGKAERHDEMLAEHSTAIAVLVTKIQGERK